MVRNDIGQISERRQEEREMSGQERIESIRSIRELLIGGSDRVTSGKLIRFCCKCNFHAPKSTTTKMAQITFMPQ